MDFTPLWEWFRWLNGATGIKLTILYDSFDRHRFFDGFLTSVRLQAVCLVLSVAVGVVGAWLQGSRVRLVRLAVQGYIQFFRNTPPLVQLYFFYFALGYYLSYATDEGLTVALVSNFAWAVICLSLYAGAFNVEIFRAGIEAVPKGHVEAAWSLGLTRWQTFRLIVFPQAVRTVLPPLGNDFVAMIKDSALVSALGVQDITQLGKVYSASTFLFFETYNVVAFLYLVMTLSLSLLVRGLERRLKRRE